MSCTIAVDAMGGDYAPEIVISALADVISVQKDVRYLLYGDSALIEPLLNKVPALSYYVTVCHADSVVSPDDKPSVALRQGRSSSMYLAIDAVKQGVADAVVSAGNTGALMAIAKMLLKTLPGIDRPAIVSCLPTIKGRAVMLDLGANVDCDAANLFQFAIMGHAYAKIVLGLECPTVGLLNIGQEQMKGREVIRQASSMLESTQLPFTFVGYVEADRFSRGVVDVLVTDGFTGNVCLKTAEGIASLCKHLLKEAFSSSMLAQFGGLCSQKALRQTLQKVDQRKYNGAMFAGLNGIVVKSHGGADAPSFANALMTSVDLVNQRINTQLSEQIQKTQHLNQETAKLCVDEELE